MLIKDNIDTYDMPTTAGSKALVKRTPTKDAFIVTKLREAGAIILGKALHPETSLMTEQSQRICLPGNLSLRTRRTSPQSVRSHSNPRRLIRRNRSQYRRKFCHGG